MQIIDRLNVGGPTKYVSWIASGLPPHEFEVYVVTGTIASDEGDMAWFAAREGVEPLIIPELSREISPYDIIVLWKLLAILIKIQPDIIHTHKAKAGAIGRVAALVYSLITRKRCRVVHVYHGHIFHGYYGWFKTFLFLTIERLLAFFLTDIVLTISRQQSQEIKNKYKIGRAVQHRTIPYGLDFSCDSKVTLHNILGLDSSMQLIGQVGRLCEIKNHEMFIQAARLLKDGAVPCKLVIIGDGHLRSRLETMVRELDLADTVYIIGFRDDVMSLYKDLTLISITSLNEGTPFTLIEAMYFEVPVISTMVGGVVDLMGHQVQMNDYPTGYVVWTHGITVDCNDVQSYVAGVKFLLNRPDLRLRMGTQGAQCIKRDYTKSRFIADISKLYREVINVG